MRKNYFKYKICEWRNYIAYYLHTAKFLKRSFCQSLREESHISFNCNLSPFSLKLTQNLSLTLMFLSPFNSSFSSHLFTMWSNLVASLTCLSNYYPETESGDMKGIECYKYFNIFISLPHMSGQSRR